MWTKWTTAYAALAVGTALLAGCAGMERNERHVERRTLSAAAEQAVKAEFPEAKIEKVKWEREGSIGVFSVDLEQGEQEFEVEVTPDGTIITVATELEAGQLPQAVTDSLAKSAKGAVEEASKEELRAEPKLVKLPAARTTFTVAVAEQHKRGEIEVAPDGSIVTPLKWERRSEADREDAESKDGDEDEEGREPAMNLAELQKVAEALQKQMPQAALGAVKMENEDGVPMYEVKLTSGETRMEALVAGDGTVAEMETVISAKELPAAAAATVAKEAPDAQIVRVEKEETMAEVKLMPLATPKVTYEVKMKGKREVELTPEGVILTKLKGD